MTPTLFGRIQTRWLLLLLVAAPWTILIVPFLTFLADGASLRDVYEVAFVALLLVGVIGIGWELVYHRIMQYRWEKDWPALLGLVTVVNELVVVALVLVAWDYSLSLAFYVHFATVWFWIWFVANGPVPGPVPPVALPGRTGRLMSDSAGERPPRAMPDLGFLDAAATSRNAGERRRRRLAMSFSVLITVVWFLAVLLTGSFGRVWDNIVATPTMVFGSFVAGSTPQGGGAVAFPVFTKGLGVTSEVARTFSLAIQSVGMTAASVAILVRRRQISVPAVLLSIPAGLVGLFVGFYALTDRTEPFWPSVLPGPYVKVFFTLLVVAMAFVVFLGSRVPVREVRTTVRPLGKRQMTFIVVGALVGGLASSQVGSGADVLFYLVVVVMLGLEARVAVPSSVLVMTVISIAGFLYLGLVQGQMDVVVSGDVVTRVGDTVLADPSQYPSRKFDLLGLWIAAVPVVCWGAPLGSAFAARITSRQLAVFVVVLAGLEGLTTVIFLKELRTDPALVAFAVIGAIVLGGTLYLCTMFRHRLFDVRLSPTRSLSRESVDVGPEFVKDQAREERADPIPATEEDQ